MNNKLDALGVVCVGFTVLFCGLGFYWIISDINEDVAAKIGLSSFWLILSFMFIVYSLGIGRRVLSHPAASDYRMLESLF